MINNKQKKVITEALSQSIAALNFVKIRQVGAITKIVNIITKCLKTNHKIVLFGNGGSACDAMHIATEFVVRFMKNRTSFPAIALNCNAAVLTAIGNDYGFDYTFARQVEALVTAGDVVIGISTSGKSVNVINGILQAKKNGAKTIGFTGKEGNKLAEISDITFNAPSSITAKIQEIHITVGHIICQLVEDELVAE